MVHSEDTESHVRSVEEDMEYWRTKRLEPRIFRLIRKGKITFHDILEASKKRDDLFVVKSANDRATLEERVDALELTLGDFIRGINIATSVIANNVLVEESRAESGVYLEEFKFEHRKLSGTAEERVSQLELMLGEEMVLLQTLLRTLTSKGFISEDRLREMLSAPYLPSHENGARIVVKAWLDPSFKSQLMNDAKGTLRDIGFSLSRTPKLVVVENTVSVHNVIVCTLCSCYPYELLGNPPWWYKHDVYKQTIIRNARQTLAEMFSFRVPQDVEIRVHDSTSDIRYMVLPRRPEGTEELGEQELAKLVTEDSLIGVGDVSKPLVTSTP